MITAQQALLLSLGDLTLDSVIYSAEKRIEMAAKNFKTEVILIDAPFYIWAALDQNALPKIAQDFLQIITQNGFRFETITSPPRGYKIIWNNNNDS